MAVLKALTPDDVATIVKKMLEYGHGTLRVVVQGHMISTIHPDLCLKTPQEIDKFLQTGYGESNTKVHEPA